LSTSQSWLNQTASIAPDSSATRAVTSVTRRARRLRALRTTPLIAASSSPKSSAIRSSGAAGS
jgi:hypothetical protein